MKPKTQAGQRQEGRVHRVVSAVLAFVLAVTTVTSISVALASPANAANGDPFDPSVPTVFIAQQRPTQLFRAETSGSGSYAFSAEGAAAAIQYNALAFNTADNYLYGMVNQIDTAQLPFGSMIRIGQGGTVQRVGNRVYSQTQGGAGSNRWFSGAFNAADGLYYVSDSGNVAANRTMLAINPTTGNEIRRIELPETLLAQDFTIDGGFAWGMSDEGNVRRVDLSNGNISSFPNVLPATVGGYGAVWTFGNGNFGFSSNEDGKVYQVRADNRGSGSPTFTLLSTVAGPSSDFNDGAAIPGLPTDLAITKSGPATFISGSRIEYTITVTNNGPGVSSGWTVTDTLPAGLSNPSVAGPITSAVNGSSITVSGARLDPGQSTSFRVAADAVAGDGQCIVNVATVLGNEADPVDSNNQGTAQSCAPTKSYTVAKTADVSSVMAGGTVRYTVNVTNTGQSAYTPDAPASFEDDLAGVLDDATYNNDVSAGGAFSGSKLTWSGALAVGATVAVTYSVTVNDPLSGDRTLVNAVVPTTTGGTCATDTGCSTSTPVASYEVNKSVDRTSALPGDRVTYTITVTNTGDVAYTTESPASFTDELPGVLDDAVYNDDATEGAVAAGSRLTWKGSLGVGETRTITYSVTVSDPVEGDYLLRNTVSPTGPGGLCGTVCETTTPVGSFRVSKTADSSTVTPGAVVNYTITVTSIGQAAYPAESPASFSDDLSQVLDDATYNGDAASSSGAGVSYTQPTLAWSGALGVGETVTITYSVTITSPATGDRKLDNTVVTPPGVGANCVAAAGGPECTAQVLVGTYSVQKDSDATSAFPGDIVTYQVKVSNTGTVDYTTTSPAAFSDDLTDVLDDATYNGDVSAGGEVSGSTLTWSGALAVGDSVVVTYSVTVDTPVRGDFTMRNVVVPTGPGGECIVGKCGTVTPIGSYTVEKTSDRQDVTLGGTVTYEITVTNIGQVDYTEENEASFVDDLSNVLDDAAYNDDATEGAERVDQTLTWSSPLPIGESKTITYSMTVNRPATGDGFLRNAVLANAPGGGCATVGGCETTTPIATYRVLKEVSSQSASIGDTVTFSITVENTGQVDYTKERPASFTDDLTSALSVGTYGNDATRGATYRDPNLVWSDALAVGQRVTVTYSFVITKAGQITNVVVTPDESGANCTVGSESDDCRTVTRILPPGLASTGSALLIGGGTAGLALVLVGLWFMVRRRRVGSFESE